MTFKFVVPGRPRPKGRPRFTCVGRPYTPKETVEYERAVRKAYQECGGGMFDGPVSATVRCYFDIPQSYTKKRTAACKCNIERPTGKNHGDCDNLAKGVLDSLNGIAYKDDSQIVSLEVQKLWGSPERAEVIIRDTWYTLKDGEFVEVENGAC